MLSKKSRPNNRQKRGQTLRPPSWLWLAIAGAGALAVAVLVALRPWAGNDPEVDQAGAGTPRLEVEQTTIDEGYIKYSVPVQTIFRLRNVGDQPLEILGQPQVVLVEGC